MVEISEFSGRTLLGLSRPFLAASHPNSNAPEVIGPLWGEMSAIFFKLTLARSANPVGVGAMWPDVSGEAGSMIYFAGYEIDAVPEDSGSLEVLELEPGRYAFVEHVGPMSELPSAVRSFYSTALPQSGEQGRPGMDLEIYSYPDDPAEPARVVIAAPVV